MRIFSKRCCGALGAVIGMALLVGCAVSVPTNETSGVCTVLRSDLPTEEAIELQAAAHRAVENVVGYLYVKRPPKRATIILLNSNWSRWRYMRKACPRLSHAEAATIETKPGEYTIVLSKRWSHADLIRTLRHELAHFVIASNFNDIPPWLDEGLAIFFELVPPYGRPHPRCHNLLKERLEEEKIGPLNALVSVPVGQCLTRAQYPQAWGLTWFLLTDPRFGKVRIRRYMENVTADRDSVEQFKQHFDLSPDLVEPMWRKAILDARDKNR